MLYNVNQDNIKGFATFKYKSIPNQKDLSKVLSFYSLISSRETDKNITIFDWDGNIDTITFKFKQSLQNNDIKDKTEQLLGCILALLSNNKESFIIIREPNQDNSHSTIYGFHIIDKIISSISSQTLIEMNENSKQTTGLNPEKNIDFIDI